MCGAMLARRGIERINWRCWRVDAAGEREAMGQHMQTSRVEQCRLCGGALTGDVLDLGAQPISNRLLMPGAPEADRYPLAIVLCRDCGLPQLSDNLPSSAHFHDDYVYLSGASSTWVAHCDAFATRMVEQYALSPDDLVVELGSNDGTLLKAFVARGIQVLGVEPSGNVAQIARDAGVRTITAFFNAETAAQVARNFGRPRLIIANNVLAHVPDTGGFLRAAADLVAVGGALCFEFPHNSRIINQRYFDTIYHEHYTYLGVGPLQIWAAAHGMAVVDVVPQPTHGGSLRLFMARADDHGITSDAAARIADALAVEANVGAVDAWHALGDDLDQWRRDILARLRRYQADGMTIAGSAAASKATVLSNYLGIDASLIACCADASLLKQGRRIPGTQIPIIDPDELRVRRPDVVLVFAWNIFAEIAQQLSDSLPAGTRLICPLPSPVELCLPI